MERYIGDRVIKGDDATKGPVSMGLSAKGPRSF